MYLAVSTGHPAAEGGHEQSGFGANKSDPKHLFSSYFKGMTYNSYDFTQ